MGKTTSGSSAACTEMWTLQFLLSGDRWQLGRWPFLQIKSNRQWWLYHGTENETTEQTRGWAKRGAWNYGKSPPKALLWDTEGDWCACCHLHTKIHQLLVNCVKNGGVSELCTHESYFKKLSWNSLQSLGTVTIRSEQNVLVWLKTCNLLDEQFAEIATLT